MDRGGLQRTATSSFETGLSIFSKNLVSPCLANETCFALFYFFKSTRFYPVDSVGLIGAQKQNNRTCSGANTVLNMFKNFRNKNIYQSKTFGKTFQSNATNTSSCNRRNIFRHQCVTDERTKSLYCYNLNFNIPVNDLL